MLGHAERPGILSTACYDRRSEVSSVRPCAVAGAFYPADPGALCDEVDHLLEEAPHGGKHDLPRALIAPHAGYAYSGPVAASAFRCLAEATGRRLTRVVVIGPSHYVAFRGIAVPHHVGAFRTPLAEVPVDREALTAIEGLPGVVLADEPHRREHAVEVELPFLQRALGGGGFALVPLVVGDAADGEVERVLEAFADDPGTLVVVSSDLSHFLPYEAAVRRDRATAGAIERLEGDRLGPEDACGHLPVRGWLAVARRRGLGVERLDLRNSGDTAGDRRSVVGYGAWTFGDG
jgi:AmmeMemoRadiSam system protein B